MKDLKTHPIVKKARRLAAAKFVKHAMLLDLRYPGLVPKRILNRIAPIVRAALALEESTKGHRLVERVRDEEKGCWWAWSPERPGMIEIRYDGGASKFLFAPKLGSPALSQSEWTVLISTPIDGPDEAPIRTPMSLREVLSFCGVEESRKAVVFAHQRATLDANRLGIDLRRVLKDIDPGLRERVDRRLGGVLAAAAGLERQLIEVGEVVPTGRPRSAGADIVDLDRHRALKRAVLSLVDDEAARGTGLRPEPEHVPIGSYSSAVGAQPDREITLVGHPGCWNVFDARIHALSGDDDLDIRWLPEPFTDRDEAFAEGERQLALAKQNGGPTSAFEV